MVEYIEREAAIKKLDHFQSHLHTVEGTCAIGVAKTLIKEIPAADARPVARGKWIDCDDEYYGWNMWACSACGEEFILTEGTPDMNEYHFCPNCGADMRPVPQKE
jgi:hypothetical protein